MDFVSLTQDEHIATVTLNRGKVNALNEPMVEQFHALLGRIEGDPSIAATIVTGQGKFFSFGFDIPVFMDYTRRAFRRYLTKFVHLYKDLFLHCKPLIGALNGHAIAGGCMLATTCDYRLMASGKAKISLNEIGFGSSVFAGSVEMLKFWVGPKLATEILYHGKMYTAEEAERIGLIDQVSSTDGLKADAATVAHRFARRDIRAFGAIKMLLRRPVAETMHRWEQPAIEEFLDVWYSPSTQKQLQDIKIYS